MIKLTLKDGSIREIESAASAAEIIKGIGAGLYKAACCVKINGEVKDLRTVIDSDCEFEVMTFDSIEGKKTFWHTASHILAQAVKRLYPNAKLAIGPAIDNGFYYDFDLEKPFTAEELTKIEAEMKKIVKEGIPLESYEMSPEDAIKTLEEQGEIYKVELCQEHAEKGEPISFYKQGEFSDLCARSAPYDNCSGESIQAAFMYRRLLERFGKKQNAVPCLCNGIPESVTA